MKLIVLGVDGLAPDYAKELGYPKLPYEAKLTIPRELYYNGDPLTIKIWPVLLGANPNLEKANKLLSKHARKRRIKKLMINFGAKEILGFFGLDYKKVSNKFFNSGKKWGANPIYYGVKTVANKFNSIMWNVPTLNPEYIGTTTFEHALEHKTRMYIIWKLVTEGMSLYHFDLGIAYCHIVDLYAHHHKDLRTLYLDIHEHAQRLSKRCEVMLVSDHGTLSKTGEHTDHAYLGCTRPIKAKSVVDVSSDIENILYSLKNEIL